MANTHFENSNPDIVRLDAERVSAAYTKALSESFILRWFWSLLPDAAGDSSTKEKA